MNALLLVIGVQLIAFTGPNGNKIEINPKLITSIREPQVVGHYDPKVRCVIYTSDSQFIGVKETCDRVRQMLTDEKE